MMRNRGPPTGAQRMRSSGSQYGVIGQQAQVANVMSQFAIKDFSHAWPGSSRKRQPAAFFAEETAKRLQQEDRLIAIGLLVCFAVQLLILLF